MLTIVAMRHARGDLGDPLIYEGNPHLNVNTAIQDIRNGASVVRKYLFSAFYAGKSYRMRETAFGLRLLIPSLPQIELDETLDACSTGGPDGRIYPLGSTEPWEKRVASMREFLPELAKRHRSGSQILWVCSGVHMCVIQAEHEGLTFSSDEEMQSWALTSEAGQMGYCSTWKFSFDPINKEMFTSLEVLKPPV